MTLREIVEQNSIITLTLFAAAVLYILLFLPGTYLTAQYTTLSLGDVATIITPIGTILASILLASLYRDMLNVQSTQVDLMEKQAQWVETANAPAVMIDRWVPEKDYIGIWVYNMGNSPVEEMQLITDLEITDMTTGETLREYQSTSTLKKQGSDGFESRFLPEDMSEPVLFNAGFVFEQETYRGYTLSGLLNELSSDDGGVMRCVITLTLQYVAPGGIVDDREFYKLSVGVSESDETAFDELVEKGKWQDRPFHIQPE